MTDPDYGVQGDGSFRRKHVDEIRSDSQREFKNRAGDDIELNQGSPQQQLIDMFSVEMARAWAALENTYYASFFQDAAGEALGKQLALAGFSRIPSRSATGEVEISRDSPAPDDITIPAGTVVTTQRTETRPPIPFETIEDVILESGGTTVTAPIEALKPWQTELDEEWLGEETNVVADSITRFDDPVAGVDAVTNPLPTGSEDHGFVPGRDRETDAEFRLRYENSLAEGGVATLRAVRSSVFHAHEDIQSVGAAEVRDPNVGYGVRITVLAPGVDNATIARALAESRAGGLDSLGTESATVTVDGDEKTESFDRAARQTIYVEADLTVSDTFPGDGVEQITDRIIRYIGGTASDEITYPGLEIGEDVIYDQVFRRIMEIQGVVMGDLLIGTSADALGEANITVADDEAAMTGTAEVTINVIQ